MLSPFCVLLLVRLGDYIVNLCDFYFYRLDGKLTGFFGTSGVHLPHSTGGQFHYHCVVFSSQLKWKIAIFSVRL